MRTLSAFVAAVSLFLTVASLLVIGGAVFALVVFFPLFLLALGGVFSSFEDRTVRQHDPPPMDPSRWRSGS